MNYHKDRTIPNRGYIWVFGSNLAGVHGGEAARVAADKFGAEYGVGEGMTGYSYAIPTKDENIRTRSLEDIKDSIETFIDFASSHPEMKFFITRVGCGLAGYKNEDIKDMFSTCPDNCSLPEEWK